MEISFNLIAALVAVTIIGMLGVAGAIFVLRIRRAGLALHHQIAEALAQMLVIRNEISASSAENSHHFAQLDESLTGIRDHALTISGAVSRTADTTSRILDSAYGTETGLRGIANQVSAIAAPNTSLLTVPPSRRLELHQGGSTSGSSMVRPDRPNFPTRPTAFSRVTRLES
jgi:hypothetical protein